MDGCLRNHCYICYLVLFIVFTYVCLFQAIELGDALEVKYTGWLWNNNGFGKVSQMLSLSEKKSLSIVRWNFCIRSRKLFID